MLVVSGDITFKYNYVISILKVIINFKIPIKHQLL